MGVYSRLQKEESETQKILASFASFFIESVSSWEHEQSHIAGNCPAHQGSHFGAIVDYINLIHYSYVTRPVTMACFQSSVQLALQPFRNSPLRTNRNSRGQSLCGRAGLSLQSLEGAKIKHPSDTLVPSLALSQWLCVTRIHISGISLAMSPKLCQAKPCW